MTHYELTQLATRQREHGSAVTPAVQAYLDQELSIGTTERGWLLKVHNCYTDMEVLVLIPSDSRLPVEIVTDTRATAITNEGDF